MSWRCTAINLHSILKRTSDNAICSNCGHTKPVDRLQADASKDYNCMKICSISPEHIMEAGYFSQSIKSYFLDLNQSFFQYHKKDSDPSK